MPASEVPGPGRTGRSFTDRLWSNRAELLWGLIVVTLLLTFVDPVVLIGAVLVIATLAAAWAGFHELLDRAKQDDAHADAAYLRPARTSRPGAEKAPTESTWQGHNAA
ncbi:MAG: hypothetical protein QOG47_578 [Mycobacterium sp.]|jgi:hypothetical protein|nr:hypothetical protein [Mycobacterium sp.]